MCARVFSKKRGKRDQRWYLSSLCISITCPPASLLLSLHLSPLFPQLSQENYNLTAHFNISASKWVWQPLLCVPPHPHLTASSVPTSIHPPTHPASTLSPSPSLLVSFAYHSPDSSTFTMWQERDRQRWKKTKTNQTQTEVALPGYQAVSLCLSVSSVTCTRPWTYNEERYRFALMYATHGQT